MSPCEQAPTSAFVFSTHDRAGRRYQLRFATIGEAKRLSASLLRPPSYTGNCWKPAWLYEHLLEEATYGNGRCGSEGHSHQASRGTKVLLFHERFIPRDSHEAGLDFR